MNYIDHGKNTNFYSESDQQKQRAGPGMGQRGKQTFWSLNENERGWGKINAPLPNKLFGGAEDLIKVLYEKDA